MFILRTDRLEWRLRGSRVLRELHAPCAFDHVNALAVYAYVNVDVHTVR